MTRFIKSRVSSPIENNIIQKLFKDYEHKIKNIFPNKKKSLVISVTAPKDQH
jgi:hypothetical protein